MAQNDDIQIVKLKGKMVYPRLFQPDTSYDHKWQVDLLLNAEGLKQAKEMALRVKHRDHYKEMNFDGYDGSYVRFERTVMTPSGERRDPPDVLDSKQHKVPSSVGIGNGTVGYARGIVKTTDRDGSTMSPAVVMKKYKGYGLFLTGAMILDLVPFVRSNDSTDFVDEEGSFEVPEGGSFSVDDDMPF